MSAHILVTGEDAADFLQSQFSNDLRPYSNGQVVYGLWLDVKGKIVADSWVRCEGEEKFRILSEHCDGQEIADKLQQHIIADDVEIEMLPPAHALTVIGEDASRIMESANERIAFSGRHSLRPSCELVFDSESAKEDFLTKENCELVTENWIHIERIRAGFPLIPQEIGPSDLPGEAAMTQDAVSLTKGCFLGQEVVARMHNVGKAQRALFVVTGSGELPSLPQSVENTAAKVVGELRSAYTTKEGWRGVALLRIRYVEDRAELSSGSTTIQVEARLRND